MNKHMKNMVIKEIQIKTTVRSTIHPPKMAKIKKTDAIK